MKQAVVAVVILLVVFGATGAAIPQAAEKATVQGVVLAAGTERPIAGARLTLMKAGQLLPGRQTGPSVSIQELTGILALSGAEGRFEFRDIDPGRYKLTVVGDGYVRREFTRDADPLVLTAGQTLQDLVVRLTPAGTITGFVRSPSGRPLAGVPVRVLKRSYTSSGTPQFRPDASTRTNDRGEYRFFWLTPGRYSISAGTGANTLMTGAEFAIFEEQSTMGNVIPETYPEVFYPTSITPEAATSLDLQPGSELRGINFVLDSLRKYRIRGRVLDPTTGRPPAKGHIVISGGGSRNVEFDPATGAFELSGLVPGTYSVSLVADDNFLDFTLGRGSGPVATVRVVVTDADIDDLAPTWIQPTVLSGRVRVEGELPSASGLDRLRVQVRDPESNSRQATVAADGTFVLNNLPDAPYRISVTGVPANFYLKEIRHNNRDILGAAARFSGNGTVEIVISSRGGRVSGLVVDEQRRPAGAVEAVLVPNTPRDRPDLFKTMTTGADGRFSLSGIAPGEYRLFAWRDPEPYAYFDPEVVKRFDPLGVPVSVSESSAQSVDVRAIPWDLP